MSWLTVEECKKHLGKSAASAADDEELYGFIVAAEDMIDALIGRVRPSTTPTTDYQLGGSGVVILDRCPVAAVVSVHQNGVLLAQADLDVNSSVGWWASERDMAGGLIRHTSWFSRGGRVKVVYHPGSPVISGKTRLAGLELVAHLWQMSQNGMVGQGNPLGGTREEPVVFRGFALPARVRELLGLGDRATDEQLVG